ncbi:hypothetical protein [Listeria rustica]|uniref:Uncharacterized protein n=1 Tax=Listeria rustica TaxID=2713503 RepID=A0A7W1T6W0_9LIST|nr:hypothetical protein [Listeria rustica]MBA3926578.1 hypothetical protein [Listeria rustica]
MKRKKLTPFEEVSNLTDRINVISRADNNVSCISAIARSGGDNGFNYVANVNGGREELLALYTQLTQSIAEVLFMDRPDETTLKDMQRAGGEGLANGVLAVNPNYRGDEKK